MLLMLSEGTLDDRPPPPPPPPPAIQMVLAELVDAWRPEAARWGFWCLELADYVQQLLLLMGKIRICCNSKSTLQDVTALIFQLHLPLDFSLNVNSFLK